MIDIKTLQIGSHVLLKGERVKVLEISNHFDNCGCIDTEKGRDTANEFDPIPITEELLKELGFEYHEYDNGKLWERTYPNIYKSSHILEFEDSDYGERWRLNLWSMKETSVETHVKYLHELENWIYMVYGKELISNN